MTGDAPLPAEPLLALAQGRGAAFAGLAELAGVPEHGAAAAELGTSWALADLAVRLSHPDERELARALAAERVSPAGRFRAGCGRWRCCTGWPGGRCAAKPRTGRRRLCWPRFASDCSDASALL